MTKKINQILNQVLIQVEPSKEDLKLIDTSLKDFLKKFNQNLKKLKIKAEVFIGGSFAKKTVIKKDSYDVDVFVRFDKKYDDKDLSGLTAKALKGFKNLLKVHGSRDYYRVIINSELYIELIVYYYKGFINFLKAMTKVKKDKLVIDIEKYYKNKSVVLMDINSSKLNSPIILVDPTYKQRNTLAALSQETFNKFQTECSGFLKNPSIKSFEVQKTDLEKIKSDAIKKEHKKTFTKEDKIYSKEKISMNLPQFIEFWKKKNLKKIKEMYIEKLEIV